MGLVPEDNPLENLGEVLPGGTRPAPAPSYTPGAKFAERYEIIKPLGRSALGIVYQATDTLENRLVALKILRRELMISGREKQRFERFLKIAKALEHPNFSTLEHYGQWQDEYYIVREFIAAPSLEQVILERKKRAKGAKPGTFTVQEVMNLVNEVGRALVSVAEHSFHGSLAPTDLFITDTTVKIANLGVSRIFQPAQYSSLQIYYGNGYFYLAPEYDRAGAVIDHRADLYALAVMAYEMLTGEIPRSPVVPPSMVNPAVFAGFDGPILKALESSPRSRQESIAQFLDQLGTLTDLAPASPPEPQLEMDDGPSLEEVVIGSRIEIAMFPPAPPEPPAPKLKLEPIKPVIPANELLASKDRMSLAIKQLLQTRLTAEAPEKMPVLPTVAKNLPKSIPQYPVVFNGHGKRLFVNGPLVKQSTTRRWQWLLPLAFLAALASWIYVHRDSRLNTEAPKVEVAGAGNSMGNGAAQSPQKPNSPASQSPEKPGDSKQALPALVAQALAGSKKFCPEGMAFIPGGDFTLGDANKNRDFLDFKAHSVKVNAFCIDAFEWPNQAHEVPKTGITFAEAQNTCVQNNKRLCTEVEWERACKGQDDGEFPYGSQFTAGKCNTRSGHKESLAMSGEYTECLNSWGVADMSGNAAEWTQSLMIAGQRDRIIRGGSYQSPGWASRCSSRKNRLPDNKEATLGFRCCAVAAHS